MKPKTAERMEMNDMEELEKIIIDYKNRGIKKWTIVRLVCEIYSRSKYSQWKQTQMDCIGNDPRQ